MSGVNAPLKLAILFCRRIRFPAAGDRAIHEEVGALFIPGARYRKSGVVFFGLERAGAPRQGDLFTAAEPTRPSKLYKAVDALNARYGRGKVFSAAEGIASENGVKRQHRFTTENAM